MVYHVLQQAVQDKDTQRIKAASGELLEKFGRTNYAPLGALAASKAMIDAGAQRIGTSSSLKILEEFEAEAK